MTDPPDLAQETLREFLDAEKACPDPPPEVGQRVFTRLSTSLGLPPGAGDAMPTSPGPTVAPTPVRTGLLRRTLAGSSGRGLATFLVGAAVGAATYGTVQRIRQESELPAPPAIVAAPPAPEPPSRPPPAPPAETAEVATVAAQPPATAPSRVRETEPSLGDARDRGLAAERKLVEMGRTALARGHTDLAIAALRRHTQAFPNGQLAEERDSLLVQALVAKGEFAQARQRAARFHRQHPHSLFLPVVDQALRSIP
jgi:hypothetical protein